MLQVGHSWVISSKIAETNHCVNNRHLQYKKTKQEYMYCISKILQTKNTSFHINFAISIFLSQNVPDNPRISQKKLIVWVQFQQNFHFTSLVNATKCKCIDGLVQDCSNSIGVTAVLRKATDIYPFLDTHAYPLNTICTQHQKGICLRRAEWECDAPALTTRVG